MKRSDPEYMVAQRQRLKTLRIQAKAKGLCSHCFKNLPMSGKAQCLVCLNRQKEIKNIAKAAGLCGSCKKVAPAAGKISCANCLNHQNSIRSQKREMVYAAYGNKCSCPPCGETRWQFLTLDHMDDNGAAHRQEIGTQLVEWAFKHDCPAVLRLLCFNCNSGRERNNKICPHLTETSEGVGNGLKTV